MLYVTSPLIFPLLTMQGGHPKSYPVSSLQPWVYIWNTGEDFSSLTDLHCTQANLTTSRMHPKAGIHCHSGMTATLACALLLSPTTLTQVLGVSEPPAWMARELLLPPQQWVLAYKDSSRAVKGTLPCGRCFVALGICVGRKPSPRQSSHSARSPLNLSTATSGKQAWFMTPDNEALCTCSLLKTS